MCDCDARSLAFMFLSLTALLIKEKTQLYGDYNDNVTSFHHDDELMTATTKKKLQLFFNKLSLVIKQKKLSRRSFSTETIKLNIVSSGVS